MDCSQIVIYALIFWVAYLHHDLLKMVIATIGEFWKSFKTEPGRLIALTLLAAAFIAFLYR